MVQNLKSTRDTLSAYIFCYMTQYDDMSKLKLLYHFTLVFFYPLWHNIRHENVKFNDITIVLVFFNLWSNKTRICYIYDTMFTYTCYNCDTMFTYIRTIYNYNIFTYIRTILWHRVYTYKNKLQLRHHVYIYKNKLQLWHYVYIYRTNYSYGIKFT